MVSAHDFEVNGIYYVKNSDGNTVSVSYKGTSSNQYSYEYYGCVIHVKDESVAQTIRDCTDFNPNVKIVIDMNK